MGKQQLLTLLSFFLFLTHINCQEKPNILWITIEDTSPEFIGCFGNKEASTPHIDALAAQGVRFTNAFSTGTVCSPSRNAIITGVRTYEMGTGNHRSNYAIPDFIKGFPFYLKEEGYYVTNNSKTDYNIADEKAFIAETWDESSRTATWKNRPSGAPFFAVFNYADSHQSRTMSMPYNWYEKNVIEYLDQSEIIPDDAFAVPPIYPDNPDIRKQVARVYNSIKLTDNKIGKLLHELKEDGLDENTIIFFYADHGEGIPRGKTNGIDLGYRVPFVIYFPEKYRHLNPWKDMSTSDELITFHDLAPTILSLTGIEIPSYMHGRALLGEERRPSPKHVLLSSDRADNGPDMVRSITDGRFMYSFNFMNYLPAMRYIRYLEIGEITQHLRDDFNNHRLNNTQSSMFLSRPREFFYDTESDIWETNNLIGNTNYKSIIDSFRMKLIRELVVARDAHFMPEFTLKNISIASSPYKYRMNEGKYPVAEIINKTMSITGYDHEAYSTCLEMLNASNPYIRFWGAVTLMGFPAEILKGEKDTLTTFIRKENYPPAKIYLASLNYKLFNDPLALRILQAYILIDDPDLNLMAINQTLYFPDRDELIEIIKEKHALTDIYKVKAACIDFLDLEGLADDFQSN